MKIELCYGVRPSLPDFVEICHDDINKLCCMCAEIPASAGMTEIRLGGVMFSATSFP